MALQIATLADVQAEQSLAGILYAARRARQEIPPMACEIETLIYVTMPDGRFQNKPAAKEITHFRRNGDLIDRITTSHTKAESGEFAPTFEYRSLWNGERFFHRQQAKDSQSQSNMIIASVSDKKEQVQRHLFDQDVGAFLDGRFWHNTYAGDWTTIMQDEKNVSIGQQKEEVDGRLCLKITAKNRYGDYDLWIDTEQGYNIKRANIVVGPEQFAWGKRLSDDAGGTSTSYARIEMHLGDIEIERIGEHYLPTAGRLTTRITYTNGSAESFMRLVKRTDVRLNPDFDAIGAFVMDLPDNALVEHNEVPGIKYRWAGGKLVPDVDELVVEQLDITAEQLKSPRNSPESTQNGRAQSPAINNKNIVLSERTDPISGVPVAKERTVEPAFTIGVPLLGAILVLIACGAAYYATRSGK